MKNSPTKKHDRLAQNIIASAKREAETQFGKRGLKLLATETRVLILSGLALGTVGNVEDFDGMDYPLLIMQIQAHLQQQRNAL